MASKCNHAFQNQHVSPTWSVRILEGHRYFSTPCIKRPSTVSLLLFVEHFKNNLTRVAIYTTMYNKTKRNQTVMAVNMSQTVRARH